MTDNNGQHDPLDMGHTYDGIGELDNLLPRWWLWLFWLCVIFAPLYLAYYHVLRIGSSSSREYQIEMAAAQRSRIEREALDAKNAPPINMEAPSKDAAILAKGKTLFAVNCVPCHAPLGQGLIGPNLTDDFWIHGGAFADIRNTISEGVPAKGMITWKNTMKPADIYSLASYVWSIHGTDLSKAVPPARPVEPEAKKYERPPGA